MGLGLGVRVRVRVRVRASARSDLALLGLDHARSLDLARVDLG